MLISRLLSLDLVRMGHFTCELWLAKLVSSLLLPLAPSPSLSWPPRPPVRRHSNHLCATNWHQSSQGVAGKTYTLFPSLQAVTWDLSDLKRSLRRPSKNNGHLVSSLLAVSLFLPLASCLPCITFYFGLRELKRGL